MVNSKYDSDIREVVGDGRTISAGNVKVDDWVACIEPGRLSDVASWFLCVLESRLARGDKSLVLVRGKRRVAEAIS